jgi:RND family efflux transporter MFP subunit
MMQWLNFIRRLYANRMVKYAAPLVGVVLVYSAIRFFSTPDDALLYTVTRGEFLIDIKVDGEARAMDSYIVKAPSNIWGNARIVKLAPEGTMVKTGEVLVQFDPAEFQQRLLEAQNKLETTKANLASAQANIKSQMADLESSIQLETYSLEQARLRAKNAVYESDNKRREIELSLKKSEISFQQLLDRKTTSEKINQATLRQAELEVEQALIKLRRAQDDLDKLTINAEVSGLVVYHEVWEGDHTGKLKIGYSPWRGQPLMEIPTQNRMKVSVMINEADISRLALDQETIIRFDAVTDTLFNGKVREIAALAHRENRLSRNVFDAEIYLDDYDDKIKPGMTAHCQIIVKRVANVLFVPLDAVQNIDGNPVVYDEDGDARAVTTGVSGSDFIIIENGINEGDRVRLQGDAGNQPGKSNQKPPASSGKRQIRRIIIG